MSDVNNPVQQTPIQPSGIISNTNMNMSSQPDMPRSSSRGPLLVVVGLTIVIGILVGGLFLIDNIKTEKVKDVHMPSVKKHELTDQEKAQINSSLDSFANKVLLNPARYSVSDPIGIDDRGIADGVRFNEFYKNLSTEDGNKLRFNYLAGLNGDIMGEEVLVVKQSSESADLEQLIPMFKDYFVVPVYKESDWKKYESGTSTYHELVINNSDGSYDTRSASVGKKANDSGAYSITLAACRRTPNYPNFDRYTCFSTYINVDKPIQ